MIQQKAASFGLEGVLCRRASGVLASVFGSRACIWCFHLNMARHPGFSNSSMHQHQASQRFPQLMPASIGDDRMS